MSETTLLVVAKMVAKPGQAEALKRVLSQCIEPSRREAGNIHYDLYRSVEDQETFLFHERWQNGAAIDEHERSAHFQTLLEQAGPLLAQAPEITKI
ncbi:putative quinol monooxygenase [Pantoea sp. 1.19]|uniref:putative quinol monooxygenase n=1 Tax=Pantoea sp. 1.19 TaxID=1925589 RepID=UPI000948E798|nr:putative quinol monooxygenase [Pantoea sp. 1.19]